MIDWHEIDFRRTPFTLSIAALIVAIEIVSSIDVSRREYFFTDLRMGMWFPLWSGEIWRPFTTTILHGGLLHAAFNVLALLAFGHVLERYFGALRFAVIFVLLGYTSSLLSFVLGNLLFPRQPVHTGVGVSGVVYGLFGILWVGSRWRHEFRAICSRDLVVFSIGWFFLCILLTYSDTMPIDNYGHAAGLAYGALYGMAAFAPRYRYLWIAAAVLATVVVLATMIAVPGHPLYEAYAEDERMRKLLRLPR